MSRHTPTGRVTLTTARSRPTGTSPSTCRPATPEPAAPPVHRPALALRDDRTVRPAEPGLDRLESADEEALALCG